MYRSTVAVLILLAIFFSAEGLVSAADSKYEQFIERKASDILPEGRRAGAHYKVRETVPAYGFMDHFTVDSDYGIFDVTGDGALRKLLREINALSEMQKIENTEAFGKALAASAMKPVDFTGNLVTHPADTVASIPKGVAKLFSSAYASITTKKQTGEDSVSEAMLSLSKYKREYAYNLGVDVYSSNPVLQKELNRVGWAAAMGNLSFSAATAPIGGGVGMAISSTSFAQTVNDYLRDQPPSQIRLDSQEKLSSMGVAKADVQAFLENKAFTPRHSAVIVGSLVKLKDAIGRDTFIKYASSAVDEEQANFMMNIAETVKGYNEQVSPIKEIRINSGFVVARAENNTMLIPLPLDYGVWTERAEKILTNMANTTRPPEEKTRLELWVAGKMSPLARKKLEAFGVNVIENASEKVGFMD